MGGSQGYEEGDEGGCQGLDQGRPLRSARLFEWAEEVRVLEGARWLGGRREQGGEESRQEGDVREGRHREGQAGQDGGEGLPRRCLEEERLRHFGRSLSSLFETCVVETH